MNPAQSWGRLLTDLAIPDRILAAAPTSPYGFGVRLFDRLAREAMTKETPSRARAREALPAGGTVVDVGCGGGAASLSLGPRLGTAIGVDQQEDMLAAFAARASELGVAHHEVLGGWPDVADATPDADIVACHHVFYNVQDLGPFVQALTSHARSRVVVEMTGEHPLAWLGPLWRRFHDLDHPSGPTVGDAIAALRWIGLDVAVELWDEPSPWRDFADELVPLIRTRLCLPASRDPDIQRALKELELPPDRRQLATLWWPGTA